MIEDHCVVMRYLLVFVSIAAYLFSMLVMGIFMMGVETEDGEWSFRVTEDNAYTMLFIWVATHVWGFIVLNGARVIFVTLAATFRARSIKRA